MFGSITHGFVELKLENMANKVSYVGGIIRNMEFRGWIKILCRSQFRRNYALFRMLILCSYFLENSKKIKKNCRKF